MSDKVHVEVEGGGGAAPQGSALGGLLMVPAIGCIALGVALLVWPALLRYLVAGAFIALGLALWVLGRKVGRAQQRFSAFRTGFGGPGGPFGPQG